MGLEIPEPGRAVFQRTFSVADQVSGGDGPLAMPLRSGPRHWVQGSAGMPCRVMKPLSNRQAAINRQGLWYVFRLADIEARDPLLEMGEHSNGEINYPVVGSRKFLQRSVSMV